VVGEERVHRVRVATRARLARDQEAARGEPGEHVPGRGVAAQVRGEHPGDLVLVRDGEQQVALAHPEVREDVPREGRGDDAVRHRVRGLARSRRPGGPGRQHEGGGPPPGPDDDVGDPLGAQRRGEGTHERRGVLVGHLERGAADDGEVVVQGRRSPPHDAVAPRHEDHAQPSWLRQRLGQRVEVRAAQLVGVVDHEQRVVRSRAGASLEPVQHAGEPAAGRPSGGDEAGDALGRQGAGPPTRPPPGAWPQRPVHPPRHADGLARPRGGHQRGDRRAVVERVPEAQRRHERPWEEGEHAGRRVAAHARGVRRRRARAAPGPRVRVGPPPSGHRTAPSAGRAPGAATRPG